MLKENVCLFETKEPMIHCLYDKQWQLFKEFMKQECLDEFSGKKLEEIKLDNKGFHLKIEDVLYGYNCDKNH